MADEVRNVESASWVSEVTAARNSGFTHFDWLGAVDEIGLFDTIRVVIRLLDPTDLAGLRLQTHVARTGGVLDTVGGVFAGATWHEREAAEGFGVVFTGGDTHRLLLPEGFTGHPMRKDDVLGARVATAWPGSRDPDEAASRGRRRMVPVGVPDADVWGGLQPTAPAPDPATVAASATGGRVRRRTP